MRRWAVTTTDPVLSTLLASESFEDEAQAREVWNVLVGRHVERPGVDAHFCNTRVNLIEINGRDRTLRASVDIYLPRGDS